MGNSATKTNNIEKLQSKILREYPWIDNIKESTLVTDCKLPDCPIIYANDMFERMTRYPKEEIIGRNCRFLQGKLTDQNMVKAIRNAVDNGLPLEVEILNYRKDGVPFMNVFLMLPVHATRKSKVVTHFVAIQKDVTTYIPDDSTIDAWDNVKLAMMADANGFSYSAQFIMENEISGADIINMNENDLIELGVYSRKERRDLLKWVLESKEKKSKTSKHYPFLNGERKFGAFNSNPNLIEPRNMAFWEKSEDSEVNTATVKCYFGEEIKVFTVKHDISVSGFYERIKLNFGYTMTAKHIESDVEITTDQQLAQVLDCTHTVCFKLDLKLREIQNGYDIVCNSCVPMVLVNKDGKLEYLNKAGEKMVPKVAGRKFSSVFGRSSKSLPAFIGAGFLCTIATGDGNLPVLVSVSPYLVSTSKIEEFVLTIVLLPINELQNISL